MHYLYILLNEAKNRTYTGVADDVNKRLAEHNSGKVKSSRPYRPYKIAHAEAFKNLSEARQKEKFYKSTTGRRRLKEMLFNLGAKAPRFPCPSSTYIHDREWESRRFAPRFPCLPPNYYIPKSIAHA